MADTATWISGLRASNDFGTDERPKNFREAILWLDPNGMTPLTAISAKMKKETTDDPEFSWWEEVMDARRVTTSTTGTGTSLTVAALAPAHGPVTVAAPARQFKPGDLLQVIPAAGETVADYDSSTGAEIVRVDSITSDTVIVVTRDFAGNRAGAPALAGTERLMQIGSAYTEGATSPDSKTSKPTKTFNYTQIFKSPFQLTNTAKQTRYRTGDPWENDRKRAMFEHSQAMELACLFGIRQETVGGASTGSGGSANEPLRAMAGLRAMLTSNVNISVGSVTEDFFFDSIAPLFDYNAGGAGDQRICFCGNGAINSFNKAVRDAFPTRMQYTGTVKFYGMKLQEYTIPQGTFFMKTHPLLNTDPVYTNSMFVVNGKGIILRPLRGRDTKIQQNIQANDADLRKDQWLTEFGIELHFERTQGYFAGITY